MLVALALGTVWASAWAAVPMADQAAYRSPEGLTLRARVQRISPPAPTVIRWRHGGEGLGGKVVRGVFPRPDGSSDDGDALQVGQWSAPLAVTSFVSDRFPPQLFLTVTGGSAGRVVDRRTRRREGYSRDVVFEFELAYQGRVVKRFTETGPDGGTVTIVIPAERLVGDVQPDSPEFLDGVCGVLQYATRRAEFLEQLPWAERPLPERYLVLSNVGGYGVGFGYGIRTTDQRVTWAELRSLRQLGVNGLRSPPEFLLELLRRGDPRMEPFRRGLLVRVMGFPVPVFRPGRPLDPEAGCPFGLGVAERTFRGVEESVEAVVDLPVDQVWGLTVDEIGTVIDRSPEGKGHLAACPRCAAGFRRWLAARGLKPADFKAADWSEVRPLDVWDPEGSRTWLDDPHAALLAYWTRAFNNHVTAMLFTPLRKRFGSMNEAKQRALEQGSTGPEAARPWVYSFALRGNTFLMKGHSLDFFDFYREADNAIVYETSNRDPRIWGWDSYLCDVQRVVGEVMGTARGIYIKPHRGAPIQRMLSAVSRGNTMIYWYTYGPDYKKGDSFSGHRDTLALVSKAAHLLGVAEDALYGAKWAAKAEVAVVKPETTQRWMNLAGNPPHLTAAWENAKWIYTALTHSHLPVDPLDETMLATEDLSRYKIIYVNGSHLRHDAAEALVRYVEQGGTLYTSGWGLTRDEANGPLDVLQPVLGLVRRDEPEMWYRVELYGASHLEPYDDPQRQLAPVPAEAAIVGIAPFNAAFRAVIGREALRPAPNAQVLAEFADGAPAAVRHRYGRGQAMTVGFFTGLEYSATVRRPDYDMRRDFDPGRRRFVTAPALALTQPVVDVSDPLVEGVLLETGGGQRAITLANWAYAVTAMRNNAQGRETPVVENVPAENLQITVRTNRPVRSVTSCMLQQTLEFAVREGSLTVRLPRLEEGDVLVIE